MNPKIIKHEKHWKKSKNQGKEPLFLEDLRGMTVSLCCEERFNLTNQGDLNKNTGLDEQFQVLCYNEVFVNLPFNPFSEENSKGTKSHCYKQHLGFLSRKLSP